MSIDDLIPQLKMETHFIDPPGTGAYEMKKFVPSKKLIREGSRLIIQFENEQDAINMEKKLQKAFIKIIRNEKK